jgi:hypothetical protein
MHPFSHPSPPNSPAPNPLPHPPLTSHQRAFKHGWQHAGPRCCAQCMGTRLKSGSNFLPTFFVKVSATQRSADLFDGHTRCHACVGRYR